MTKKNKAQRQAREMHLAEGIFECFEDQLTELTRKLVASSSTFLPPAEIVGLARRQFLGGVRRGRVRLQDRTGLYPLLAEIVRLLVRDQGVESPPGGDSDDYCQAALASLSEPRATPAELKVHTLEPRILLSATWIELDTGAEICCATDSADLFLGDHGSDFAEALGGNDRLFGGGGHDFLFGGDGDDLLHGGRGDDLLSGGDGGDSLRGGNGDDLLNGGDGDDLLNGGRGTDLADYRDASAGVHVDLTLTKSQDTLGAGVDKLRNLEGVLGSDFDDHFSFDQLRGRQEYLVNGGGGEDTIDLSDFSVYDADFDAASSSLQLRVNGSPVTIRYDDVEHFVFQEGTGSADALSAGDLSEFGHSGHWNLDVDAQDVSVLEGEQASLHAVASRSVDLSLSLDQIDSFGGRQDRASSFEIGDDGSLHITGNGWKKVDFDYQVTEDTILEFDFFSGSEGEIHGIGFENNNSLTERYIFQLHGTQDYGASGFEDDYAPLEGEWKHYEIRVGDFYTGNFDRLVFANDHDVRHPDAESVFRNISVYEEGDLGDASVEYHWSQIGGPEVTLLHADTADAAFISPRVEQDTQLTFEVRAFDGHAMAVDLVTVTIENNAEPLFRVDAGEDLVAPAETSVTLGQSLHVATTLVFDDSNVDTYGGSGQDRNVTATIEDGGHTLHLEGNGWKKLDFDYTVTEDTILAFDFLSNSEGEIHGIGFDNDNAISRQFSFQLHGAQNWGVSGFDDSYAGSEGEWKHYEIRVGDYYTGEFDRVTFTNDHDVRRPDAESFFRDVTLYEADGGGEGLQYHWTQIDGPEVTLSDPTSATPDFLAPDLPGDVTLTFQVQVISGALVGVDTVSVVVQSDGHSPIAVDDQFSVLEDAPTALDVLQNDVGGNSLSITGIGAASHGQVSQNSDGTLNYAPDHNYFGGDSFSYAVTDGQGNQTTATVTVDVLPQQDAPVAYSNHFGVNEDTPTVTANVVAGSSDPDGDALSLLNFDQPAHGQVADNGDGTFTYTPHANFHGSDEFSYTITDGNGNTAVGTIHADVAPLQDAPEAFNGSLSLDEDTSATIDVLAGSSDVDGDPLSVLGFTPGAHGQVVDNGDGTFTYTPDANFHGSDVFTFTISDGQGNTDVGTISVVVSSVQETPTAFDGSLTVTEDAAAATVNVLAGSSDPDGDPLSLLGFTQGAHGQVADNGDGTFTYTPDANFHGSDAFSFTISDGQGNTDVGTISVNVSPQQDPPTAFSTSVTVNEDASVVTADLLAGSSDVDGDPLSLLSFTQGAHGQVVDNGDGTFTYAPDADYHGGDAFTFTISDGQGNTDVGTVSVTVSPQQDPPAAFSTSITVNEDASVVTADLLAGSSDADGDPLSLLSFTQGAHGQVVDNGDGTFTYAPDADYHGGDAFTFTISDGQGNTDVGTVSVSVSPQQDPPAAFSTSITVNEDASVVTVDLLAGSSDADGDPLSLASFTQGAHGQVVDNGDGTFTYTPDANYHGNDAFAFTITDGQGNTDVGVIDVTVAPQQDAPVAWSETLAVDEGETVTSGNVLAASSDADGDPLSITAFTPAAHGQVTDNGDGTFSYTPDAAFNGVDTFTYTLSDGQGNTDSATLTVLVSGQQDLVVDAGADVVVSEGDAVTLDATINPDYVGPHPILNLVDNPVITYGLAQDGNNVTTVEDNGSTVHMVGNAWKQVMLDYTVTADTILEFDFLSTTRGDVHGIGFDTDNATNAGLTFRLYGSQNWGISNFGDTYVGSEGQWKHFSIRVGDFYTGNFTRLFFANDHDVANPNADGFFRNVQVYEEGDPGISPSYNWLQIAGPQVSLTDPGSATLGFDAPNLTEDTELVFQVEVFDGLNTSVDTVTVLVTANDDAPVATDDAVTTAEDTALTTSNLLANDLDLDSPVLRVAAFTQAAHGSVAYNTDGTFTYTPDADFNGSDSFTYTISDFGGNQDSAAVSVTVTAQPDAPQAWNGSVAANEDSPAVTPSVLANSTDAEGDSLSLVSFTQASSGQVASHGDGTFTYTPDADFSGSDSFNYTISDGNGGQSTGVLDLQVAGVADAPQLMVADASGVAGLSVDLAIAANLTDVDGSEVLAVTVAGMPGGAALSAGVDNGDGTWTLSAGDLAGLTLVSPTADPLDLTVIATASEHDGDLAQVQAGLHIDLIAPVVASLGEAPTVESLSSNDLAADSFHLLDQTETLVREEIVQDAPDSFRVSPRATLDAPDLAGLEVENLQRYHPPRADGQASPLEIRRGMPWRTVRADLADATEEAETGVLTSLWDLLRTMVGKRHDGGLPNTQSRWNMLSFWWKK